MSTLFYKKWVSFLSIKIGIKIGRAKSLTFYLFYYIIKGAVKQPHKPLHKIKEEPLRVNLT